MLKYFSSMKRHLAICKGDSGEQILQGKKTADVRSSNRKLPPYGMLSSGDLVYIKPSGKDIIGQFKVKKVIFYDDPEAAARYKTEISIGETQRFITAPIKIPKKDSRGWVVID